MKGILLKDSILIRKYCIFHFIVSLIFFIISITGSSAETSNLNFTYYAVAMVSIIPITISAYDEQSKWNLYEAVLPVSRKQIVLEKYLLTALIVIPVSVIYSVILFAAKGGNLNEVLLNFTIMLLFGLISPCVILPIIYKFGYLKGRIINLIIIALLMAIASVSAIASINANQAVYSVFAGGFAVMILAAAAAVIFIISAAISVYIYNKKEFKKKGALRQNKPQGAVF